MGHRACKKTQLLVWSICSKEVLVIRSKLSVKLQVSSCVGLLYNRNSILWYISCCFVEDVSGPYECSVPLGKEQTMLQGACKKNKTKNSPWIFKWNSYINENYLASITNPPSTSYRLPHNFWNSNMKNQALKILSITYFFDSSKQASNTLEGILWF